ncbi:hypothetical protein STEG23_002519 [Scotinomys teguina]
MKLASEIKELIASQGTKIKSHAAVAFVTAVAEASPWFITGGGLKIPNWEQVKVDLQKILHKKGTDNMPLVTFSIWRLIKDASLTDKVKVKEQLVEAKQSLEKIQEEEVRKSVSATDTQSEDEEESQFETKAQEAKVKEFSFSSSSESDSKEEERLEQEIVDLKKKLKTCKMKAKTAGASTPSPPPYNSDWTAVGEGHGVCLTLPQQAFPVIEMDNPNNPGQRDAERPMWLPEHCVHPVDVPADTKDHEDDPDSTNIGTGAMDVDKQRGVAKGVLTQQLGDKTSGIFMAPCLHMIAAVATLVKDSDKLTLGQPHCDDTTCHRESNLAAPDRWLSNTRITHYQAMLLNPERIWFGTVTSFNQTTLLPEEGAEAVVEHNFLVDLMAEED